MSKKLVALIYSGSQAQIITEHNKNTFKESKENVCHSRLRYHISQLSDTLFITVFAFLKLRCVAYLMCHHLIDNIFLSRSSKNRIS